MVTHDGLFLGELSENYPQNSLWTTVQPQQQQQQQQKQN
jgi:hypothetical protein